MAQIGEKVSITKILNDDVMDCPFNQKAEPLSTEGEDIENDDLEEVENDGGKLGRNLENDSQGKDGSVGKTFTPPKMGEQYQRDTKRAGLWVINLDSPNDNVTKGKYPFTVAAHHLIPGNASLEKSQLIYYMRQGEEMEDENGNKFKVKEHIGYNVNGSHNGIWLPGWYAITEDTSPDRSKWSVCSKEKPEWALKYVAAVTKVAKGQFHDTHTFYSDKVLVMLDKISTVLDNHPANCNICPESGSIPPPYQIKTRLYSISSYLKTKLGGSYHNWKAPWYTSDTWFPRIKEGEITSSKTSPAFVNYYRQAKSRKE